MTKKPSSNKKIVAFKVEEELADILDQLPNKSAFIRKAIITQLEMSCPLCRGTGVLPKGLHDHYMMELSKISQRSCDSCGNDITITAEPGNLSVADRTRLEQFFYGGPLYCDDCYDNAPECDDCGWHIAPEQEPQHQHQAPPAI